MSTNYPPGRRARSVFAASVAATVACPVSTLASFEFTFASGIQLALPDGERFVSVSGAIEFEVCGLHNGEFESPNLTGGATRFTFLKDFLSRSGDEVSFLIAGDSVLACDGLRAGSHLPRGRRMRCSTSVETPIRIHEQRR